jgi:DNA-binding PadR family transcriptional regulator
MDERALLLLGVLRNESQHGYRLNDFIERNLPRFGMKRPTAYATLDRLCHAGFVSYREEREGGRPPRKVYAITPQGETHFLDLLRASLAAPVMPPAPGDVGLLWIDQLEAAEAVACLGARLDGLKSRLSVVRRTPRHGFGRGVDLVVDHERVRLEGEIRWLEGTIAAIAADKNTDGAT